MPRDCLGREFQKARSLGGFLGAVAQADRRRQRGLSDRYSHMRSLPGRERFKRPNINVSVGISGPRDDAQLGKHGVLDHSDLHGGVAGFRLKPLAVRHNGPWRHSKARRNAADQARSYHGDCVSHVARLVGLVRQVDLEVGWCRKVGGKLENWRKLRIVKHSERRCAAAERSLRHETSYGIDVAQSIFR